LYNEAVPEIIKDEVMRRTSLLALVLIPVLAIADPPATVAVRVVKYDGLSAFVKEQRGKVVVVDFWADYCIPCKREFPNLVKLHNEHAKVGLVAVSVSLDDLAEDGAKDKVMKFLQKQQATMTNLILDEKPEVWQAKFKIDGPPLVMVFNRNGELEQRFHDKEVDYSVIGKLVGELLKKQ
jgi:thiol-disulfide isomerase/thioredoxin